MLCLEDTSAENARTVHGVCSLCEWRPAEDIDNSNVATQEYMLSTA